MSLTEALMILGGLVLAGILAQGVWSSRKASLKRASMVPAALPPEPGAQDVERIEPGFDHTAGAVEHRDDSPELRMLRKRLPLKLDALIDAIAPLKLEAPISAEVAIAHLPPTRRAGSKPFMIEGLNAESGEWEPLTPGHRYGEFQAGVQMANRTGALNEIEYSEFVQKLEGFAEGIGAMADFPDMLDVAARARELDNFAGQYDAQLAVQLRARGAAWSVGYIQQHALQHGFVPGVVPGRLIFPAAEEGAPPILTLTFDSQAALADDPNQAALRVVTLAFDVPQSEPALEPFALWQKSAKGLAQSIEADVVDDHGQALRDEAFAAIGGELGQLYSALEGHDLAAGSAAARRLFS